MPVLPAGAFRRRLFLLLVAATAVAAGPARLAAQTDVIRGRVTDTSGLPLPGVQVSATSIPGNVTRNSRTNNSGAFQIAFPGGPGDYIMAYSLPGYNFRQFELKRLADEDVLLGDTRLTVIQLDTLVVVAQSRERVNRNEETPDISGTQQEITADDLPLDLQGDIAAMAASLPGVLLVPGLDGEADGFSVLGLGADQNSVTLNGMQVDANGLPRDANISSSLTTSPYDASQGGFSGGSLSLRSGSGSNFRTRGMSFVTTTPQLQWTDPAGRALGNEYTNLSLGGIASGPLVRNQSFYNVSYQLGRQSRDNQTLLTTSSLGLQTAGIAMDSVARFVGILDSKGLAPLSGLARPTRISDNGSMLGSLDFSPPNSSSGQSIGITFNGNWGKQTPVGASQLALASAGGDRTNWGGGIQGRHSGYFGLILSESTVRLDLSKNYGDPYIELPGGRVRVNSIFDDGGSGVQSLTFGGNQNLGSSSQSTGVAFQNTLSWFDNANKHRIKLSTEARYNGSTQDRASNLLGSFSFNSLADLEAGLPASFSRTLTEYQRSTGQFSGSLSLGDSYRRTRDLQFQYGIRVDGSRYTSQPIFNTLVESTFGVRNDVVPNPISFSPRIGFSWTMGKAPEIASFAGAARTPRAVIRGGVGVFANRVGVGQIGSALDNTGLPGGVQQLVCVGPAVPIPDWEAYANDPSSVPDECADGTTGSVFSNSAPNVTLFSSDFAPQTTIRSNLSWSGAILDSRFSLGVDGTYSLNRNQQRFVDLNFDPTMRFMLPDEARPVYVEPTSIVTSTGSIASADARVSQAFSRVTEMRSDLESRTAQASIRLSPITHGPTRFGWRVAYTYSNIREQVSGFSSTAGSPLGIDWANSSQGPHQISYNLRYNFFDAVAVSWNGSFRSGRAFTPTIAGDVNGDGYSNDRAFIYGPTGGDPLLAAQMSQLLDSSSPATRACLEKQMGTIAARNSCTGPWSSNASLNVTLDRAKFRMPRRGSISFSLSNPLGAADLLFNGSNDLKGWGSTPTPDQSLLYVRGFDPATQRYTYEVNQRFGATRPQFLTLRSPVMLTASIRIDLGPTRERQNLIQQLSAPRGGQGGRGIERYIRTAGPNNLLNPLATILRSQDSLQLSSVQADSIASMNRRYTYRADSLWAPVAQKLSTLPEGFSEGAAYGEFMHARRAQLEMLIKLAPVVHDLLTPTQRRKLPARVVNYMDPRYLVSIRDGNGTYVSGGEGGGFGGGGGGGGRGVEVRIRG